MEIWNDLGGRPMVLIRFNPDGYVRADGVAVRSCFDRQGVVAKAEWARRFVVLQAEIKRWLTEVPTKEGATQVKLYYNGEPDIVLTADTMSLKGNTATVTRQVVLAPAKCSCIFVDSSRPDDRAIIRSMLMAQGKARTAALTRAQT
jgi:hypothetical protein